MNEPTMITTMTVVPDNINPFKRALSNVTP